MIHKWHLENFEHVKNIINNDCFPNCMIISGNKSTGKKDLGNEISKYYLDEEGANNIQDSPNFNLIKAEDSSKIIKVDQVRELIDKIYLKSNKRIICIQDGDKLNINSSNALLKIIEEPPSGTKFIITTSKISSIIPTIISRSMLIKCKNPTTDDMSNYLKYLDDLDIDNYYVLSNLNSKYIDNSIYKNKFSLINDFFYDMDNVISSSENIINFSKKFSTYNIEHIINMILFIVINFQKSYLLKNKSKFYDNNHNCIKDYNSKKLNFIYDKLINIKRNIDIIQNNETILFAICILFKKLSKSS